MRLSNFILDNLEIILQEWEDFASTLHPAAQSMDKETLRDDAKKMLETIALDIALPETKHDRSEKSKGRRPVSETPAATHGTERLSSGFSLAGAVAEYRALRACVTRLWQEAHIDEPLSHAINEDFIRFNEAIDQAITESLASYDSQKQQQTRVFETILAFSPDLSFTFDLDGIFLFANRAFTQLLELPPDKIVGKRFSDLGFIAAAELHSQIQSVINTKTQFRGEIAYTTPRGAVEFYDCIFAPVLTQEDDVEAVAGTARNITERKASEEKNWEKANYDLLTGLPNRRLFRDRLEQDVKHAGRIGAPIALLFIDLDYFKEVNDTYGHEAGDCLLQIVAERIRSCVRETDTVARLGGDEFTVILQDVIDADHVGVVAEKIIAELANPFHISDKVIQISASIGISLSPPDAKIPDYLIKNADQAMYIAKNAGRNRFSFFSPNRAQAASAHQRLMADLRTALSQNQLCLYYQPILDITDGRIIKAEALLRWMHPEMGLLFPGQFIGAAEDAGLMNEIGNWVFAEAALHSHTWSTLLQVPFQIGINMSAMQLTAPSNIRNWGIYIRNLGLASHSISVDIKEEVLLNRAIDVRSRIIELHDAGVDVVVDDFCTGSTSMAYLKKFAVDSIKIDQSLVHDMSVEQGSQTVPQAIIATAHKMGLTVVAEGVETMDQRDRLRLAGCDYAQGYLFAAPVKAEEFEKLLPHA